MESLVQSVGVACYGFSELVDSNRFPSAASRAQIEEQILSNRSGISHEASFAEHRAKLSSLVVARAPEGGAGRLCVLGAGNCLDLDLEQLGAVYREVHLVDIDEAALERAWQRQTDATRARLFRHAPLDLSGILDRIDRWNALQASLEEFVAHPGLASSAIAGRLPGPFDVVLSACLLSQMQLIAFNVLGSSHRLFDPVRHIVNITHLRTLAKLSRGGGRALLATDLVADQIYPLERLPPTTDWRALMDSLIAKGTVIHAVQPGVLAWTVSEDPELRSLVSFDAPVDVWIWRNGPERMFLVYAAELRCL